MRQLKGCIEVRKLVYSCVLLVLSVGIDSAITVGTNVTPERVSIAT